MKILNFILAAGTAAFMFGCNDDGKKETEVTTVTTEPSTDVKTVATTSYSEGTKKTITTADVPDSIEMTFQQKYPKALQPQWVMYTPVESDYLPMDDTYYYVAFMDNGQDIMAWYNNRGEWVKTSTKIPGDSRLPDAVNKTINEQYPGYKIEEISKENDKDMDMYEVKLNKGDEKAKLKILPNGEVFKRK